MSYTSRGGCFCCAVAAWCWSLSMAGQQIASMARDAQPSFEVATIKPSDPRDGSEGFHTMGRQIYIENQTVLKMLLAAYGLQPRQVEGEPEWAESAKFDVRGVPDEEGEPSWTQTQGMLRKLLADRFGLKMHEEQRAMTVYALRVGKGGPKLTRSTHSAQDLDQTGDGHAMRFTANSMGNFVEALDLMVDRPVVDQTGLPGLYDFTLRWRPANAPADDPNAAEPLFSAIPEQLGLVLQADKAPATVLVVDHVERPSAN